MGGVGSGTWYRWDRKTTAEEVNRIDIRYLRQRGLLRPSGVRRSLSWACGDRETGSIGFRVEQDRVLLSYRCRADSKEWKDIKESVWFYRTPCHYGGERLWFLCPDCSKRVAVLYRLGPRFLCRHCYRLPYGSQNETFIDRMMRKARRIRQRLQASTDLTEPVWRKPKGMHRKTFDRLVREEGRANQASSLAMVQKMRLWGIHDFNL